MIVNLPIFSPFRPLVVDVVVLVATHCRTDVPSSLAGWSRRLNTSGWPSGFSYLIPSRPNRVVWLRVLSVLFFSHLSAFLFFPFSFFNFTTIWEIKFIFHFFFTSAIYQGFPSCCSIKTVISRYFQVEVMTDSWLVTRRIRRHQSPSFTQSPKTTHGISLEMRLFDSWLKRREKR